MRQNSETNCNWLPVAISAAVLMSGLNALVQVFRTLVELGRLAGW